MLNSKRFSRRFYNVEDATNFAYFNDLVKIIEYRDDFSVPNDSRRSYRIGVRLGSEISWGPWKEAYNGFENVKPVYRVDLRSKLDNAFEGIV